MNKLYIYIFLFFALPCFSQDSEVWTKTLQNEHHRINGTVAYLILDQPGWAQSPTNPSLILNEEQQAYLFIEQKKSSLEDYESEWMPMLIGDEKPEMMHSITLQNYHGKLIKTMAQTPRGDQVLWLAYLGNEEKVLDIKGAYEKVKDNVLEPQIMAMIRSIYIDELAVVQLFETVPFTAEVEKHGFTEEASYMANSLILTNPETNQNIQMILAEQESSKEEIIAMEREYLSDQNAEIILHESETIPQSMELMVYRSPLNEEGTSTYSAYIFLDKKYITVTTNMENTPANHQLFQEICASVRIK